MVLVVMMVVVVFFPACAVVFCAPAVVIVVYISVETVLLVSGVNVVLRSLSGVDVMLVDVV